MKLMCIMVLVSLTFAGRCQAGQTVLFDTGHGERFVAGDPGPLMLSGLAEIFRAAGMQVDDLNQPISEQSLAGVDALILSGPFKPLQNQEIDALFKFMERGGRVCITLHIAPPQGDLLERLGISYTNGVIRENENIIDGEPQNFRATRMAKHPVLNGLKGFSLYGAWGLMSMDGPASVVAATGPNAWVDLHRNKIQSKDETASFGVACAGEIGKGGFLVFGDDAIFQNKFLKDDNMALALNLVMWFKTAGATKGKTQSGTII